MVSAATPKTPKETAFAAEVEPLLRKILVICHQHKINSLLHFSLGIINGEQQFCTGVAAIDPTDPEGFVSVVRLNHIARPNQHTEIRSYDPGEGPSA